jgi:hypothetical protein
VLSIGAAAAGLAVGISFHHAVAYVVHPRGDEIAHRSSDSRQGGAKSACGE